MIPVGNRTEFARRFRRTVTTRRMNSRRSPGTTYTYDSNGNTLNSVTGSNTTDVRLGISRTRLTSVTLPGSGGTVHLQVRPVWQAHLQVFSPQAPPASTLMTATILVEEGQTLQAQVVRPLFADTEHR